MKRITVALLLGAFMVVTSGCAIFSIENYGPQGNANWVDPGETTIERVIETLGGPKYVAKGEERTIYVFTKKKGFCVLGIFSQLNKFDIIVTVENGIVTSVKEVETGSGIAVVGFIAPIPEIDQ